jgi:hypothetical protein
VLKAAHGVMDHIVASQIPDIAAAETDAIAARCTEIFSSEDACSVADPGLLEFLNWVRRARNGQRASMVSVVCPDYATSVDERGQPCYAFGGLNEGIGRAAQRLYPALSVLHRLIREELGLKDSQHYVYVADFEGFSEQNLIRVGVSEMEFTAKVRGQKVTLQRKSPVPVSVQLFSELCAGKVGWLKRLNQMRTRELAAQIDDKLIQDIVRDRSSIYRAWFRQEEYDERLFPMLAVLQAAEYATIGEILASHFANPLIIGAGSEKLLRLHRLVANLPVLCLRAPNL